jgi:hypothetical protein
MLSACLPRTVMAVLGHKTPKMAMFYCEQARQAVMNENAVAKWDASIEKRAGKALAKRRALIHAVA